MHHKYLVRVIEISAFSNLDLVSKKMFKLDYRMKLSKKVLQMPFNDIFLL